MQWLERIPDAACVIAPHPDDETIGCAGLLRRLSLNGSRVVVLYITMTSEERRVEARRARECLGITDDVEIGLCEGRLDVTDDAIERMANAIARCSPSTVLVPAMEDVHPDHKQANLLTGAALGLLGKDFEPSIMTYEGFCPCAAANCWVDISSVAECKWEALACFASQEHLYRISSVTRALNQYRALVTFRRAVKYAEAYRRLAVGEYIELSKGVLA